MSYDSESDDPPSFYPVSLARITSPRDDEQIKSTIELAILCARSEQFTCAGILEKSKQLVPELDFELSDVEAFVANCDDVKEVSKGIFVWRP